MPIATGETTDPQQLLSVGNWADSQAWTAFLNKYSPLILRYLRPFGFDCQTNEELTQRIWIELSARMRIYQPAAGHHFRAWLKRLCRSRAIDHLRQSGKQLALPLPLAAEISFLYTDPLTEDVSADVPQSLLQQATIVQQEVRRQVSEKSWQIFWQIVVEGLTIADVANAFNVTYAAAFATQKRIRKMLRQKATELRFIP
ncbi:MAG: hypothetical protein RLZZ458_3147 [Planctomycetota bacterium]|jgi:RNA polymerase sigma-70 factor (ECF subfamily)